jgi:hypothetical protein
MDMSRVDKGLQEPKFITTCSSLESLTFRYTVDTKETADFAITLIQHAPRLQQLTIDADYGDHSTTLMSHLYSTKPHLGLRELSLEAAHIGPSRAFTNFLASFNQTLTKVSFTAIHLDSGEWASVLATLLQFPSLTEMSTYALGQAGGMHRQRVHFPAVLRDPIVDPVLGTRFSYTVKRFGQGPRTLMVAYSGRSMDIALRKLAEFATPYSITG